MKITCQACQSKYTIADDKIQGRVAKVRCRKCGATVVVDATGGVAPAAPAPAEPLWSVTVDDGEPRSMRMAELVDAYHSGVVTAESFVWREGMGDWLPLGEVAEVVEALHAGAAAPAEPAHAEPAYPEPAYAEAAPGDDSAAPPASSNDPASGKFTGARDEQSVLFSLSALTTASSRPVATAAPIGKGTTKEDSGLIDLGALAKASQPAPAAAAAAPVAPAPAVLFPPALGTVEVPAPVAAHAAPPPAAKKSNTGLLVGIGVAVAGLAIAGALVFKSEPPPPPPVAAAPVVTTPPPVVAPAPVAAPTVTASAEPVATASAKPAPVAAPAVAVKRPATLGGSVAPKAPTTPAAATTPKPAPAAPAGGKKSGCGCSASDLQCQIRCSAIGK
jgi:predicted Zn finger-like uncharacterized protein